MTDYYKNKNGPNPHAMFNLNNDDDDDEDLQDESSD